MVLLGVVSMVAALFVLSQSASAHFARVSGETSAVCDDAGSVALSWEAVSWDLDSVEGRHPQIVVDMQVDTGGWQPVAVGAFTDANGRRFSGQTSLPNGSSLVTVRVTPAAGVPWEGTEAQGGGDSITIAVPPAPTSCLDEVAVPGATPTPADSTVRDELLDPQPSVSVVEAPSPEPTEPPTPEPVENPSPEPTVEQPTATPTPTAVVVVLAPPPSTRPAPNQPAPQVQRRVPDVLGQVVARQELARTGVESGTLTVAGTALLIFGAALSLGGVALGRREQLQH